MLTQIRLCVICVTLGLTLIGALGFTFLHEVPALDISHGIVPPPDPWELAHGIVPPPDPWELAHGIVPPPDPWELA